MKRLILLILVLLFYSSSAWAGACNTTITEDHGNSTLGCADNDELTVNEDITFERDNNIVINANGADDVTVTNYGTIRSSNKNNVSVECSLQWTDSYHENTLCFSKNLSTNILFL